MGRRRFLSTGEEVLDRRNDPDAVRVRLRRSFMVAGMWIVRETWERMDLGEYLAYCLPLGVEPSLAG